VETLMICDHCNNPEDVEKIVLVNLNNKETCGVMDAINVFSTNPNVAYCEPDYICEPTVVPNDPLFRNLWGMQRINAPTAWNFARGNGNVIVGVLDSGVDGGHPDLREVLRVPRVPPFTDFQDMTGHGTHVAGTIGAIGNNRIGVVGVNWNVLMAIFKIGNRSFDLAAIIRAIDVANNNNIRVLNNSWGTRSNSQNLRLAISQYRGLFVVAAGNDGTNNDVRPVFPASYNLPNIISVAATNQNNNLAPFSNFGRTVHIAAPGVAILSTDRGGRYTNLSGTSMACPHVAGAAALILSIRPNLTINQLRNIILSSARRLPSLNGRVATGAILDVANAVNLARRLT
jgi:subtilisin family serine protease